MGNPTFPIEARVAGKIVRLIEELMVLRTGGRAGTRHFVRAHLVLNGVNPDAFDDKSPDDPEVVAKLESMISGFSGK